MISMNFHASMSNEELLAGENRHLIIEQSRKLAMAAGLTKSSEQLMETWEKDPETYTTLLKGAIAAYEQNELIEELLRGAVTRLVSVVDTDDLSAELFQRCADIATSKATEPPGGFS
ncbi:MAG: hypothetical protein R3F50_11365 [Gammaproteobacteria bacterium]